MCQRCSWSGVCLPRTNATLRLAGAESPRAAETELPGQFKAESMDSSAQRGWKARPDFTRDPRPRAPTLRPSSEE